VKVIGFSSFQGTLQQNGFALAKTDGQLCIVPSVDKTERALVFVGCNKGHRGSVCLDDRTTAEILLANTAENKVEGRMEVVALFEQNDILIFVSTSDGKLQEDDNGNPLYADIIKEVTYQDGQVTMHYYNLDEYNLRGSCLELL
jgi:hypothetical protein